MTQTRRSAVQTPPGRTPPSDPGRSPWALAILALIALVCIGIELTLTAADQRLIGTPVWRSLTYQYGAFWPGLLYGWRPNYDLQPWVMFVSYAFLHGGVGHLAGNMLTLFALGRIVTERVGAAGFVCVYAISAFGGALAFALISTSPQPVVGASGALFGLAGAWQYWEYADAGRDPWRVARTVIGLVLLNVILWVLLEGLLAWEAHLGGFLAGWAVAAGLGWIARRKSR